MLVIKLNGTNKQCEANNRSKIGGRKYKKNEGEVWRGKQSTNTEGNKSMKKKHKKRINTTIQTLQIMDNLPKSHTIKTTITRTTNANKTINTARSTIQKNKNPPTWRRLCKYELTYATR